MSSKRVVLTFPPEVVEQPVVAIMVKQYEILTNILRAQVHEGEVGRMLVELEGDTKKIRAAIKYLKEIGVTVEDAIRDIALDESSCISCGACTAVCVPGALSLHGEEQELLLNRKKCILCGFCVDACPLQLIKVKF
ncbi:MAG: NIL domain-containing protein [Actinomycetota bacterium]|nr:NIL domain-containing protein [Actinomycetota bacterium]